MRLLFVGDIIGRAGRAALLEHVPKLQEALAAGLQTPCRPVNGENAAGGFRTNRGYLRGILCHGIDTITLGNHSFDQRELLVFIERVQPQLTRPVNYPKGTPGRGAALIESAAGARLLVINVLGLFMNRLRRPLRRSRS